MQASNGFESKHIDSRASNDLFLSYEKEAFSLNSMKTFICGFQALSIQ